MMRLTRRAFVKSGAGVVAISVAQNWAATDKRNAVFVFDSRSMESKRAAKNASGRLLDISVQQERKMRDLRATLPKGAIAGLTRWSDYVIVRGYAEEQGKRIKSERRRGALIEWRMA